MAMFTGDIKAAEDIQHILREPALALSHQNCRYTIEGLRDAAGNTGQRVAVTAERDSRTDDVFKIRPFQESGDRFRHGLLAAFVMVVSRPNLIAGTGEIIAKFPHDVIPDFVFAVSGAGEEDGACRGLCAFDPLGVIVRDLCGQPCHVAGLSQCVKQPARGRDAHGRPVAIAAIGLGMLGMKPMIKLPAIARVWILFPPFPHALHETGLDLFILPEPEVKQCFRHSNRHDRIIGEMRILAKERELLCLLCQIHRAHRSYRPKVLHTFQIPPSCVLVTV